MLKPADSIKHLQTNKVDNKQSVKAAGATYMGKSKTE